MVLYYDLPRRNNQFAVYANDSESRSMSSKLPRIVLVSGQHSTVTVNAACRTVFDIQPFCSVRDCPSAVDIEASFDFDNLV